ncbi:MAG: polysaccharide deacetylase family protein, partial [Promethearchaeota archaeon]
MYHNFYKKDDELHNNVCLNIHEFEKQIIYLKKFYNIISLEKLVNYIESGEDIPRFSVVLTFDDGYMNNYLLAYPILEKYNIHATIFLTTAYIDSTDWLWVNKLEYIITETKSRDLRVTIPGYNEMHWSINNMKDRNSAYENLKNVLKFIPHNILLNIIHTIAKELSVKVDYTKVSNYKMLTKEVLIKMKKKYISYGSHTNNHKILTNLGKLEYKKEIIDSKKRLEKIVKEKILFFAYPNGNYNSEIEDVVKKHYRAAVSTEGNFV